ncbi:hypothetical protein AAHC03_05521 [Spirometra sp. Aus1]
MSRARSLALFRQLHRTRQVVFAGDPDALAKVRERINSEFRANRSITDADELKRLWQYAEDVDVLLRKTVIQLEYDENNRRFKMNLRKDISDGESPGGCEK